MFYNSTRNSDIKVSSAEAITQGISSEGGLFVPDSIPEITLDEVKELGNMSYADRAAYIFKKYLIGEGRYRKNYEDIYDLLNRSEGARIAVNHAKRRMNGYCEGKMKPSEYNPGTNVFLLVDELLKYLE